MCILGHLRHSCKRVNVIFDSYIGASSIKAGTRAQRTERKRKIRRVFDQPYIRFPSSWENFISMDDNKTNLAQFLATQLMLKAEHLSSEYEVVVAGGCFVPQQTISSKKPNMLHIHSSQEEADTRMILHAYDAARCGFQRIVINSRDTDVIVLLMYYSDIAQEVWMRAETSKKPNNIPLHNITLSIGQRRSLPAFHALTGCDSTSQFYFSPRR